MKMQLDPRIHRKGKQKSLQPAHLVLKDCGEWRVEERKGENKYVRYPDLLS